MQKRDGLGKTDFPLQKSALRACGAAHLAAGALADLSDHGALTKVLILPLSPYVRMCNSVLLSSRVNSGPDEYSTSLTMGERWSW